MLDKRSSFRPYYTDADWSEAKRYRDPRIGGVTMKNGRLGTLMLMLAALLLVLPVMTTGVRADPTWLSAQIMAGDRAAGDNYGFAVALSANGRTALVGLRGRGSYSGAVSVLTKVNGGWNETNRLTPHIISAGDFFGSSVAISADGTTAVVGAYSANGRAGAAFVFSQVSGAWLQTATLTAPDGKGGDSFGITVALSGDGNTAVVGAPNAANVGAVYVFNKGESDWGAPSRLTAGDAGARDAFGVSLAISANGSTVIVGATGRNGNAGTAYIFRQATAGWSQTAQLSAGDGMAGDFFGLSVAINADGSAVAVSAPNSAFYRGAVYVFSYTETSWVQSVSLAATDGATNDRFGNSVSLSGDGSVLVVGAPNKNGQTGATYVFGRVGSRYGAYTQQSALIANDAVANDRYGIAVAVSTNGDTALVGASEKNAAAGAVYLYG